LKTSGDHMHNTDFNNVLKSHIKDIIITRLTDSSFVSANELYDGAIRSLCDSYGFGMDTMIHIVYRHRYIDESRILCLLPVF
jgi:hypothetical protein